MYTTRFTYIALLALSALSLTSASPAPAPVAEVSGLAAVIAVNNDMGCAGSNCPQNSAALPSRQVSIPIAAVAVGVLMTFA